MITFQQVQFFLKPLCLLVSEINDLLDGKVFIELLKHYLFLKNQKNLITELNSRLSNTGNNPFQIIIIVIDIFGKISNENERKLFRDNLLDNDRLYDVFLPLTTLLMIITFLSIGKKRKKNYENKLEQINEMNEKLTLENEEIKGKLNTLDEINSKMKDVEEHDQGMADYNKAKSSLDELTQLVLEQKKDINKQQNQLFDDIKNSLVKPLI